MDRQVEGASGFAIEATLARSGERLHSQQRTHPFDPEQPVDLYNE